jgi:hypothetical protein
MNKIDLNLTEITAIIDPTASIAQGFKNPVDPHKDSENKPRNLKTVLFFLTSLREREYTPAEGSTATKELQPWEQANMKAYMADKGQDMNEDYSIAKNTFVLPVHKDAFETIVGKSYEDCNLVEEFLGKNLNEVFAMFQTSPARVYVDEILHDEYNSLSEQDKKSYQAKKSSADGVFLTKGGQQIYRTTNLYPLAYEMEDVVLEHEQNISVEKTLTA